MTDREIRAAVFEHMAQAAALVRIHSDPEAMQSIGRRRSSMTPAVSVRLWVCGRRSRTRRGTSGFATTSCIRFVCLS